LWYKGFQGEFLIAISLGVTLFALSFTTRSIWNSLLGQVSQGASAATPHASRAGAAIVNNGSAMFRSVLRSVASNPMLAMGLVSSFVCLYLFVSAYTNHNQQHFNVGLATLVYALACFITHYDRWGSCIRFTFGSKTRRNSTWLMSSVMVLALSVLNGWVELGIVSAISTISAAVTIADGWGWVRKTLRKVLGAWLFDKGVGVGIITWTATLFVAFVATPVAMSLQMDENMLFVLYTGVLIAIIIGIPMVMKEKIK
jgi:hypothetical protein